MSILCLDVSIIGGVRCRVCMSGGVAIDFWRRALKKKEKKNRMCVEGVGALGVFAITVRGCNRAQFPRLP